jgi:hypothetical protein
MTFREFFAARWGKWPVPINGQPNGDPDYAAAVIEAMADYLDIAANAYVTSLIEGEHPSGPWLSAFALLMAWMRSARPVWASDDEWAWADEECNKPPGGSAVDRLYDRLKAVSGGECAA